MRISVETKIDATSNVIFDVLRDQGILENFLPGESELIETGPDQYDFVLQKQTSLITLKLPGTLRIEPAETDRSYVFTVRAKHMLAGSIDLQAVMSCNSATAPSVLTCEATLEGTGIVKQLMNNEEDRAERILRNVLNGVKFRAEAATRMAAAQAKTKPV